MNQTKSGLTVTGGLKLLGVAFIAILVASSCKKDPSNQLKYYEVGVTNVPADWRDSSFVIATSSPQLIKQVQEQLALPVNERKIVNGALASGSGGYNKNGSLVFNWHFKETDWGFTDASIEIYDGRPYSDVHQNPAYWLDTMKRYSPWNSYIKREIK